MKTLRAIREETNLVETDDKKLTNLIRAGLFDIQKLPLLRRALAKDNTKLSQQERGTLLDLLDTLISHVVGDGVVYNKVKRNVMHEAEELEVTEAYETAGDLPMVLILKRKSIRIFPDKQRVALYWCDKLKTYISVPYSAVGVGYSPATTAAMAEEIELVEDDINETPLGGEKYKNKRNPNTKSDDITLAQDLEILKLKKKKTVKEDDIQEFSGVVPTVDAAKERAEKQVEKTKVTKKPVVATKKVSIFNKPKKQKQSLSMATARDAGHAVGTIIRRAFVKENIEVIKNIIAENTKETLHFADGTHFTCGAFTAAAINDVYEAINDENKVLMGNALNESKVSFIKMSEFALTKV